MCIILFWEVIVEIVEGECILIICSIIIVFGVWLFVLLIFGIEDIDIFIFENLWILME